MIGKAVHLPSFAGFILVDTDATSSVPQKAVLDPVSLCAGFFNVRARASLLTSVAVLLSFA